VGFGVLALIVAAGLAGPVLAALPHRGVPIIVGEIAAGVMIGPSGAGWLDPTEPTAAFLAEVGFAMLMFVVGTRLPLRDPALRRDLPRAAVATALLLALALPAGLALTAVGPDRPLLLAVLVATSSAAVAGPILLGGTGASVSSIPFAAAWVTLLDILTVLAVPLVLAGAGPGRAVAGAALVVAAAAGAYAVFRSVRGTAFLIHLRSRSRDEGWALDLRVGLALLFGLAALAAVFGTSVLVAGFAAGSLLALVGEPRRLAQQLLGVAEGFLVPFFFVVLGARLEFSALADSDRAIALCVGLLAASTVLHVLVVVLVRRPVAVGLIASAALGVPTAVVSIGLDQGVLDAAQGAAVVVAALGSVAVSGVGGMLLRRDAEPHL